MNLKKITTLGLSLVMSTMMVIPAFAADNNDLAVDGGTATVPVQLTAEAATFKVTLPMALPVSVDAEGVVTTATDVKIINESAAPVSVTKVEVTPANEWSLVAFDTDFTSVKVDSKQIGFNLFEKAVPVEGLADLTDVANISGKNTTDNTDELLVKYDASLATQSTALNAVNPLNVVFTIGWAAPEAPVNP